VGQIEQATGHFSPSRRQYFAFLSVFVDSFLFLLNQRQFAVLPFSSKKVWVALSAQSTGVSHTWQAVGQLSLITATPHHVALRIAAFLSFWLMKLQDWVLPLLLTNVNVVISGATVISVGQGVGATGGVAAGAAVTGIVTGAMTGAVTGAATGVITGAAVGQRPQARVHFAAISAVVQYVAILPAFFLPFLVNHEQLPLLAGLYTKFHS